MSNLGWYQWITTASKKVGGPLNFLAIIGGSCLAVGVTVGSVITGTLVPDPSLVLTGVSLSFLDVARIDVIPFLLFLLQTWKWDRDVMEELEYDG